MNAAKKKGAKSKSNEMECCLHRPSNMTHLIAFFGGFFDETFKPVKEAVEAYVSQNRFGSSTGIIYFSWSDAAFWTDFAEKKLREIVPGSNLRGFSIVGHSYGAHSARKIAGNLNLAIDALVTIDGVSWESSLFWFSKPKSAKKWINAYASGVGDASDVIAFFGGHWGSESGADLNIEVPKATHAMFHRMFTTTENQMKSAMNLK